MPNELTIDTRLLNEALKEWSGWVKEDAAAVVIDEARLLAFDAMNFTPPFGEGKYSGSTKAAQMQGEKAVDRSIFNSFTPLKESEIKSPWLKRVVKDNDLVGVDEHFKATGSQWRAATFSAQGHKSNRSRTSGRVHRQRKRAVLSINEGYAAKSKSGVGTFKAAWGRQADILGNHTLAVSKSRIPAWVKRNFGRAGRLMLAQGRPIVRPTGATVDLGAMSHPMLVGAIDRAVAKRARSLLQKIKYRIDGKTNRINTKFTMR